MRRYGLRGCGHSYGRLTAGARGGRGTCARMALLEEATIAETSPGISGPGPGAIGGCPSRGKRPVGGNREAPGPHSSFTTREMSAMRILLTGASGYLGEVLASRLMTMPQVEHVTGMDMLDPPRPLPASVEFLRMDIRSPELAQPDEPVRATGYPSAGTQRWRAARGAAAVHVTCPTAWSSGARQEPRRGTRSRRLEGFRIALISRVVNELCRGPGASRLPPTGRLPREGQPPMEGGATADESGRRLRDGGLFQEGGGPAGRVFPLPPRAPAVRRP